jgi:putative transposase
MATSLARQLGYASQNPGTRALRAKLVEQAEEWRWCSLYRWRRGSAEDRRPLSAWPLPRHTNWTRHVNQPLTDAELTAVRRGIDRGCPFGSEAWCERAISKLI